MVLQAYNPRTQETEARGLRVSGQSELHVGKEGREGGRNKGRKERKHKKCQRKEEFITFEAAFESAPYFEIGNCGIELNFSIGVYFSEIKQPR